LLRGGEIPRLQSLPQCSEILLQRINVLADLTATMVVPVMLRHCRTLLLRVLFNRRKVLLCRRQIPRLQILT
jgi:hypothetical protein